MNKLNHIICTLFFWFLSLSLSCLRFFQSVLVLLIGYFVLLCSSPYSSHRIVITCRWTSRLFPVFYYYMQNYHEHSCTNPFMTYLFIFLEQYVGVYWLNHVTHACLIFKATAKMFSKWSYHFTIPTSGVWNFLFFHICTNPRYGPPAGLLIGM